MVRIIDLEEPGRTCAGRSWLEIVSDGVVCRLLVAFAAVSRILKKRLSNFEFMDSRSNSELFAHVSLNDPEGASTTTSKVFSTAKTVCHETTMRQRCVETIHGHLKAEEPCYL